MLELRRTFPYHTGIGSDVDDAVAVEFAKDEILDVVPDPVPVCRVIHRCFAA
jgi:hypothetical protein